MISRELSPSINAAERTATEASAATTTEPRAAHTPGPWVIDLRPDYQGRSDLVGAWIITRDVFVAEVRGAVEIDGRTIDAHMANALLIAAAPDLLEALKLLVVDLGDYPASEIPCYAYDQALAAISKAEAQS